ncbi:MAG: hypothetical protein ACYDHY_15220 [Acidiferrobacterales bacterium]
MSGLAAGPIVMLALIGILFVGPKGVKFVFKRLFKAFYAVFVAHKEVHHEHKETVAALTSATPVAAGPVVRAAKREPTVSMGGKSVNNLASRKSVAAKDTAQEPAGLSAADDLGGTHPLDEEPPLWDEAGFEVDFSTEHPINHPSASQAERNLRH